MADMTPQEFREWFNSQPKYVQNQVRDEIPDSQLSALGLDEPTSSQAKDQVRVDPNAQVETAPGSGNYEIPSDPLHRAINLAEDQDKWLRELYEEDRAKRDFIAGAGADQIAGAGQAADAANAAIVGNLIGQGTVLGQEIEYGDYVGDASSDPMAAAWQYGAMGELANRAQGGMTAVERAEMEMNRRMQERNLKSQREAQLQNLQMRGASSSGLEVAQMLGAQQDTAERMMLQNMAQEANAQQRADRSLMAGAGLASDIRGQSFGESSFNKQMQSQYQNRQAAHRQSERERQWGITTDTSKSAAGAVADKYAHDTAPTNFYANVATGNPAAQPTSSNTAGALGAYEGRNQANKAADALNEDDGIFGLGIGPF
ncbi:MAG: hypothetical protein VW405_15510 [Rhodospirillaceae bacterium]